MEGKLNAERQETRDQRGELRMKAYRHGISGKEHDAREQIEGAPEEIHQRGGIANAWRLGEWRRERRSLQSADQVGKTIAKKGAGKEIGKVAQEIHHSVSIVLGLRLVIDWKGKSSFLFSRSPITYLNTMEPGKHYH